MKNVRRGVGVSRATRLQHGEKSTLLQPGETTQGRVLAVRKHPAHPRVSNPAAIGLLGAAG